MRDLLFRNARISDGTGHDWFQGSVAATSDTIEILRGDTTAVAPGRVIDATGLYRHWLSGLAPHPPRYRFAGLWLTQLAPIIHGFLVVEGLGSAKTPS